jgi:hypothetical protein
MPRRDLRARRDQRPGTDHAVGLDLGTVEDDRADADQHAIVHGAAVQNRTVADGDVVADHGRELLRRHVDHGAVLDVAPCPDGHVVDVATDDRAEPDARLGAEDHATDDGGTVEHDRARIEPRRALSEGRDHLDLPFRHNHNMLLIAPDSCHTACGLIGSPMVSPERVDSQRSPHRSPASRPGFVVCTGGE